jgi:dsRNA-specific ribonuclease
VDLTSARSLLNRYSLGIPSELCTNSRESFMMKLPVFGENTLTLSSHLPGDVRHVDLPVEFHNCNKRDKMNMMALMACVRLHKLKLLNDRLLPIQRRDIQKTLIELTMSAMDVKISPLDTISLNTETPIEVFVYGLEASGDSFDQFDKMLKGNGRKLCIVSTKEFPQTFLPMTFVHPELGPISYHLSHPTQTVVTPKEWSDLVSFYTFVMNARWTKRDGSTFFRFNIETLNGVVSPYLIGCLSKDGSIDWPRMAKNVRGSCRSIIDRIEAVRNYSESELKEPRICCTIYDHFAFYIIFGGSNLTSSAAFPHNERGFETYYQYMTEARNFEVDQNGRLFHGQRLWYLPRRPLHEFSDETSFEEYEQENVDKSLDVKSSGGTVMLPQDAIMEATFADSSLYLHLIILPQFLFYLDHNLSAHAFLDYTSKNLPILGQYLQQISDVSLDPIKEAITARSCGLGSNYDKLEWRKLSLTFFMFRIVNLCTNNRPLDLCISVGDAVLKLIHTDALLSSSVLRDWVKYLHEGDLSMLRGALGSNETLAKAAKNTNIDKFIYAKQLGRVQWSPNCLELMTYEEDGTVKSLRDCEIIIGKKTCADVVESLMGLIYMHFGYEAANDVAFELGISILKGERVDKSIPGYVANKRLLTMAKSALNMNTFKRPELIEEALTHPSCLHEQVPSYQNLEWIGDAVLCLFARHWIFQQFPHLHVSAMNLLEASLICNETLAYVCLSQGIHRFMNHRDPALPSRIEEVERALSSNGRGLWTTGEFSQFDFCLQLFSL